MRPFDIDWRVRAAGCVQPGHNHLDQKIRLSSPGADLGSTARPNALTRYQAACFLDYAAINTPGSGW